MPKKPATVANDANDAAELDSIFSKKSETPDFNVVIAPPKSGGDAIELSQFDGEVVALFCRDRDEKKTRFGQRRMTSVYIVDTSSTEPLAGIMFQSYFQDLDLGKWYIGRVKRVKSGNNLQWILSTDELTRAEVSQLVNHLRSVRIEDDARKDLL